MKCFALWVHKYEAFYTHELDGETIRYSAVAKVFAVPTERGGIGGVSMDDEGKAIAAMDCTRFMQMLREGSVYVLTTFYGMVGDLPAEYRFKPS